MFDKLNKKIIVMVDYVVIISEIVICILIFSGAIMRYIFRIDFYGSEELVLFFAFWLYFFGSILAAKHNTHIKADMIDMFIKNKTISNIVNIIKLIINLIVCTFASYWSIKYLIWNININMKSNVFKYPMYLAVLPIVIFFVIWMIYCISDLILYFRPYFYKYVLKKE